MEDNKYERFRKYIKLSELEEFKEFIENNKDSQISSIILELTELVYIWADKTGCQIINFFPYPIGMGKFDFVIVYKY